MSSRRMVVVCPVLPYPPAGGSRKRTMRLLEAAERADLVPHLLTTDPGEPGACEELRSRGWTVEVLPEPSGGLAERLRQQLRRLPSPFLSAVDARLREIVRSDRVIVQLEHTQSASYAAAAGSAPVLLSLHNVDSELMRSIARARRPGTTAWLRAWNRWQAMRAVERRNVPVASAVLCVSEGDAGALAALNDDVIVAANGVDEDFFAVAPEPSPAPHVFFFGQLDYPPNDHGIVRFLREAWPLVVAACPEVRLRIAGGGASDQLRGLVDRTHGSELVGFVEDLVAELTASRLTIVPLWAGGGTRLKVLESLAAARPVVGTALGVEGLGFESGRHGSIADSPAALAEGIVELIANDERTRLFARQGRELAEAYRWPLALAPAEVLYRRLAAEPEPAT